MARPIHKLSARFVSTVKKKGRYSDGLGLYLQVGDGANKSWLFRYQLEGKKRQMGLGPLHAVSLSDARTRAEECRRKLVDGIDPIEERRMQKASARLATSKAHTFKECAEALMRSKGPEWQNAKHSKQWGSTLETYVYPTIGELNVSDIDTGMMLQILEPIWSTKPETARRVRGRVETILDWAKARGWREGENPAMWRGHLDKLLPSLKKASNVRHHPALPYAELGTFYEKLVNQGGVAAEGLRFLILTAARTSEVTGVTWDEIDLDERVWTIPADRMKANRHHRVPLSDEATGIVQRMLEAKHGKYVFPGGSGDGSLSNAAFTQVLKRMKCRDITVHGFRSTFRDWGAEQTAYPSEVLEMALAHTVGSKVEAAYRRGDLFEKRRRLMADWASFCQRAKGAMADNVVPLGAS